MPGGGPKSLPCVLCKKRTKPSERRKINEQINEYLRTIFLLEPTQSDVVCNKCRHVYYAADSRHTQKNKRNENPTSDEEYVPPTKKTQQISSPPSVALNIPSITKSHSYCLICRKPGLKLLVVPSSARFHAFLRHEIIIPAGSRCCPSHLQDNLLNNESLLKIKCVNESVLLNRSAVLDLLKKLRTVALNNKQSRIDFDSDESLSSSDYINLTGISKDSFQDLYSHIKDSVRNTPSRSSKTSLGYEEEQVLGSRMLYLSKQINKLQERVEKENLIRRKAIWIEPEDSLISFPRLDEHELRDITCGSYQLKLSTSYTQEHLAGNCEIHVHQEDGNLIRVRLQSRHISSKTYVLWIEYSCSAVTSWYCTCRAGARVVGVCSHVAAVLWYLGYARHNPDMDYGVRNWGDFVADALDVPQSIDSSDSEDSVVEE